MRRSVCAFARGDGGCSPCGERFGRKSGRPRGTPPRSRTRGPARAPAPRTPEGFARTGLLVRGRGRGNDRLVVVSANDIPPPVTPRDSAFLKACRREPVPYTPVWFMRQAGRSLPEYLKVREGIPMLESCRRPELVAEITMQPVRRHK